MSPLNLTIPVKKLFGLLVLMSIASVPAIAADEDDVKARTAPVGSMCMSGDDCAAAPAPVAAAGPKSGKDVYGSFCTTCHGAGVLGAPKLGSAADWAPRAAKGKEALYANAIKGINAMPPKGMCAACTDDEIKGAVDHMLDNSK